MRKTLRLLTPVVAAVLMISALVPASQARPFDRREHHPHERQHCGAESGRLTGQERAMLNREANYLRQKERYYWADGRLTSYERRDLQSGIDRLNRDIYRESHDGQYRYL